MDNRVGTYHAVSASLQEDGSWRLRHTWIDHATRRVISENLECWEPPYGPPATWQEHLMIGVSELLERRVEEQLGLW